MKKAKFMKFMKKCGSLIFSAAFLLLLCIFAIRDSGDNENVNWDAANRNFFNQMYDEAEKVSYNEFQLLLVEGVVDRVYYNTTKEFMVFTLTTEEALTAKEAGEAYTYDVLDTRVTTYAAGENFRENMLLHDVDLRLVRESNSGTLVIQMLLTVLPVVLMIASLVWIMKAVKGQGGDINEQLVLERSTVKLSDVIGLDEVLSELNIIIKLISDPHEGVRLGAKIPHGILLSGPAGVGKTMIAKAISNEANVPFMTVNGSDFQELYVGNGARRVRQLFQQARAKAPCIIFIDEFDAIGTKRDSAKAHSEDVKTINALLKEMDGFKPLDGVFVIAATNFPEKLDSAVIRSGRFDREVHINPPKNWKVRKSLFDVYLKDKPLAEDVDVDRLAKTVGGFTGADIAAVCNEAALVALSRGTAFLTQSCFEEAIDRKLFKGSYSKDDNEGKDKEIVAYHEAGHAIMAILTGSPVSRASIRPTTSGVGGAVMHEDKDSQFITQTDMENRVKICCAGRIAEQLQFKEVTTGASNDIQQATNVVAKAICQLGFNNKIGFVNTVVLQEAGIPDMKGTALDEITDTMHILYESAEKILTENFMLVDILAKRLMEVQVMSGDEILEYLKLEGTSVE